MNIKPETGKTVLAQFVELGPKAWAEAMQINGFMSPDPSGLVDRVEAVSKAISGLPHGSGATVLATVLAMILVPKHVLEMDLPLEIQKGVVAMALGCVVATTAGLTENMLNDPEAYRNPKQEA